MKTVKLAFELLSWWHAGSGLGRGGEADALVIRNARGLPYLPGKTVKGLMRDAMRLAEDYHDALKGETDKLFGMTDPTTLDEKAGQAAHELPGRQPGSLRFSNAVLPDEFSNWVRAGGEARKAALFSTISSTALNSAGVMDPGTLRTIEVCPPLTLIAHVAGPNEGDWIAKLTQCAALVRSLGSHRHRGLGRCQVTLAEEPPAVDKAVPEILSQRTMQTGCVWLEIELLSDVIVSASAATTGGHDSLDYLPGSVLLGTAAAQLFKQNGFGPDVFLSGKVRFGDGLPLAADGTLGWPVPLNGQFIKKEGPMGDLINGLTDTKEAAKKRVEEKKQAQQMRGGYLALRKQQSPDGTTTSEATRFELEGDYLLKTTLDREKFGRAKDRRLFEYETLPAGTRFVAALRWPAGDPALDYKIEEIVRVLTGPSVGLGRSRNAQFGQARITLAKSSPSEPESPDPGISALEAGSPQYPLHFYLVSDLVLPGAGGARLVPEAKDFGLSDDWQFRTDRSFLRTRRYSPWNVFHHIRLTERQVLMRGSVLTFARRDEQSATAAEVKIVRELLANGVGESLQDGLGFVLLNPDFVIKLPILRKAVETAPDSVEPADIKTPISIPALAERIQSREMEGRIQTASLRLGRVWAHHWLKLHRPAAKAERLGRSGKSQWNKIRQIALSARGNARTLQQDLMQFCTKGLRKKYWTHPVGRSSLWDELKMVLDPEARIVTTADDTLAGLPQNVLVCSAIAVAAETIVQRLQGHEQEDGQDESHPGNSTSKGHA